MAKKTYIAKHRILVDAKKNTYVEPGTRFQIEADEGERLVGLGAATEPKGDDDKKASASKKSTAKKADDDGDGGDLV